MSSREDIEAIINAPDTFQRGFEALKAVLLREPTLANYNFAHRVLLKHEWPRSI